MMPHLPGADTARLLRRTLVALFLLLCLAAIAVLALDVSRQIRRQETARSDNIQWLLSQVEVEFLTLQKATEDALYHDGNLETLRLRFDVFFSRMSTLNRGEHFLSLKADPDYLADHSAFEDFFARTLPLIDGPDAALQAGLPAIAADLANLRLTARSISLQGIKLFARISDAERQNVGRTLAYLSAATALLVFALLVLVAVLTVLDRVNRQRARDLRLSLDQTLAVIGTARDAVIVTDATGHITEFNDAASRTFGHARSEVLGRPLGPLIAPPATGESPYPPFAFPPGPMDPASGRQRQTARRKDGSTFTVEASITEAGPPGARFHVAFLRDLTPEVAAEQALLAARDEARAGEHAKANLLAVMSHEMRTPLNGLLGTMELLEGTRLTARQGEFLRVMRASGRLLLDHVNNVLEISRHDSGKSVVVLEPVDLRAMLIDICDSQRALAEARGNRLVLRLPDPPEDRMLGDPLALRQVLLNLVGNAIKFTKAGEIAVEIEHMPTEGQTEIRVTDTGIGIPEDDLTRIFDDFVTLDTSYARSSDGTGLGLGIARRMVEAMGGTIGAESELGEGSLFWVRLPWRPVEDGAAAPQGLAAAGPALPPPLRLLVVEDNPVNRLVTREMLERDGHHVTEAHDGEEALALTAAQGFDAVLMDISMPRMDGIAATRAIRARGGRGAAVPILALTANALPGDEDRFRAAGMQQVLVKPVTTAQLRAAMCSLGIQRPAEAAAPRPASDAPLMDPVVLKELSRSMGPERLAALLAGLIEEGDAAFRSWSPPARPEADPAALGRQAHRLAGACAVFGARRAQSCLVGLEVACHGGDPAAITAALAVAMSACEDTKEAVRRHLAAAQGAGA